MAFSDDSDDDVENPEAYDSTLDVPVVEATVPLSFRAQICTMLFSISLCPSCGQKVYYLKDSFRK